MCVHNHWVPGRVAFRPKAVPVKIRILCPFILYILKATEDFHILLIVLSKLLPSSYSSSKVTTILQLSASGPLVLFGATCHCDSKYLHVTLTYAHRTRQLIFSRLRAVFYVGMYIDASKGEHTSLHCNPPFGVNDNSGGKFLYPVVWEEFYKFVVANISSYVVMHCSQFVPDY